MGIGHVMRCLALAQAWQDQGGSVVLVTQADSPALLQRLADENIHVHTLQSPAASLDDALETGQAALSHRAPWIVLDGYHFSPEYRQSLREQGLKLLVLDDLADTDLSAADLLLNQNAYAQAAMYPGLRASLLLGSRYTLLRREFLPWRATPRSTPAQARQILITLGGGDPDNVTQRVLQLLADSPTRLNLTIIVGSANPHLESLRTSLPPQHDCELRVNPPDLPQLMSQADVAITASGSSCWELACLGVPMLLIVTADNQRGVAALLAERGLALDLGWHENFPTPSSLPAITALLADPETRARMSTEARTLMDGQGAARVVTAMKTHPLSLRAATADDSHLLWQWVNDPAVRQSAFQTAPVPWEGHQVWFARRLADSDCQILIGMDPQGTPIGQVRFEREEQGSATVDISLAPDQRGKGYAPKLLRLAVQHLFEDPRWKSVEAWIKPENTASQQTFTRAGFLCLGEENVRGHTAIHYTHTRHDPS